MFKQSGNDKKFYANFYSIEHRNRSHYSLNNSLHRPIKTSSKTKCRHFYQPESLLGPGCWIGGVFLSRVSIRTICSNRHFNYEINCVKNGRFSTRSSLKEQLDLAYYGAPCAVCMRSVRKSATLEFTVELVTKVSTFLIRKI